MNSFKRRGLDSQTPWVTYSLVAVNVGICLYMLLRYQTTQSVGALIDMGAKSNLHIVYGGEWWRLITAAFLHIGFEHLLFNNLTIYFIGIDLEKLMGSGRFLMLFLIASIGGNLFSFALNTNVSAGASTGIFGLFVAYIILSRMYPSSYGLQQRAASFSILIILNIISGIFGSNIDNWGHIGGAVFGGLITLVLGLGKRYRTDIENSKRIAAGLSLIALGAVLAVWGYFSVTQGRWF